MMVRARTAVTARDKYGGGSFFHAFAAHFFGDAGDDAVGDGDGGFGSVVARADAGAAGGEDDVCAAGVGDGAELFLDGGEVIGQAQGGGDFPAEAAADGDERGAGSVFALAFGGGVADGEDGYAHKKRRFEKFGRLIDFNFLLVSTLS